MGSLIKPVQRFFVILWMRVLRYRWSRLRRSLFERGARGGELPEAGSLEAIRDRLQDVTWTADGLFHLYDAISYPQTTWAKKRDDCDGFAALAAALLRELDPATEPVLLTAAVLPLKKAHTVCVFRRGGSLRLFDNARLREETFDSYRDVAVYVARRGDTPICWDVADPVSLDVLEFHRSFEG